MALDKLNLFTQISGMQGVKPAQSFGGEKTSGVTESKSSSNNPFGGETVGVNTNIGVGDEMSIAAQAGKKAGSGKTLAFA